MVLRLAAASCLVACLALTQPVAAASSDWVTVEGARVRLVTAGGPTEAGVIEGALEIALEPGWKTYWRDPGDAGVPPSIDVSRSRNVAAATLSFPAPERFDDGVAAWAGYEGPVAFPVAFRLADPAAPTTIAADVFLGVCKAICIPLQARLTVDPAADSNEAIDAELVAAASAALPGSERPDFSARIVSLDDKTLTVAASVPAGTASAELFVAGADGFMFGTPERLEGDGGVGFSLPVLAQPDTPAGGSALPYTLVTAQGAVSGMLALPETSERTP